MRLSNHACICALRSGDFFRTQGLMVAFRRRACGRGGLQACAASGCHTSKEIQKDQSADRLMSHFTPPITPNTPDAQTQPQQAPQPPPQSDAQIQPPPQTPAAQTQQPPPQAPPQQSQQPQQQRPPRMTLRTPRPPHGPEPVRSRHKSGTAWLGRYITIQSVTPGLRPVPGALPMPASGNKADFVRQLVHICKAHGIRIWVVMADGGFFAAGVVTRLVSRHFAPPPPPDNVHVIRRPA